MIGLEVLSLALALDAVIVTVVALADSAVTITVHGLVTNPPDMVILHVGVTLAITDSLELTVSGILVVPSTGTGNIENPTVVVDGDPLSTMVLGLGCDSTINDGCVTAKATLAGEMAILSLSVIFVVYPPLAGVAKPTVAVTEHDSPASSAQDGAL